MGCDSIRNVLVTEPYHLPDNGKPVERRGRKAMDLHPAQHTGSSIRCASRDTTARPPKMKQWIYPLWRAWCFRPGTFYLSPSCKVLKTALPYMGGFYCIKG